MKLGHIDLSKMVGPLPLGAWVAAVGGGLGFMLYQRRQADIPADGSINPDDGTGDGTDQVGRGGFPGQWTQLVPVRPPPNVPDPNAIHTLNDWRLAAIRWLILTHHSPITAETGIDSYLAGRALTASQLTLVDLALGHIGPPPSHVPPPHLGTPQKPPPGPPKPPPSHKPPPHKPPPKGSTSYTVHSGDTLWGIAQHFYGSGSKWPIIYNANRSKIGSNPNLIHVGLVLTIPNA